MDLTPISLLERLRRPGDEEAWSRFVELATPLLYSWAQGMGLQPQDRADLVQDVLAVLVQKLPEFSYDKEKSFRGWMRTIAMNKWRAKLRRTEAESLDATEGQVDEPASPESEVFWEQEYRDQLVAHAMEIMKSEFEPATWKACWEHVVSGRSAAEIGHELGLSPGAVYVAKSRVLRRLREELKGMME